MQSSPPNQKPRSQLGIFIQRGIQKLMVRRENEQKSERDSCEENYAAYQPPNRAAFKPSRCCHQESHNCQGYLHNGRSSITWPELFDGEIITALHPGWVLH